MEERYHTLTMNKGLDSLQGSKALDRLVSPKKVEMAGVCARDELEEGLNNSNYPLCLVVNTDVSFGEGEHWVALFAMSRETCEFFDSYGAKPSFYHISIPIASVSHANTLKLQSELSSVCGHYCLFYLCYRSRGLSPRQIFHCFNPLSVSLNDGVVYSGVMKLLKRRPSSSTIPHPCFTCAHQCCKPRRECKFIDQ